MTQFEGILQEKCRTDIVLQSIMHHAIPELLQEKRELTRRVKAAYQCSQSIDLTQTEYQKTFFCETCSWLQLCGW